MRTRHFLLSAASIFIAATAISQTDPAVTSQQIGNAALQLVKDFSVSDAASSHPIVKVAPVENDTNLPLKTDNATLLIRSALASDGVVTVAADGAPNADALFSSRLRREGDGYAFAGSVVALGTGNILWRGNTPVLADDSETAPSLTVSVNPPAAEAKIPPTVPASPAPIAFPSSLSQSLPEVKKPSAVVAVPSAAATAAIPATVDLGPAPEPEFAPGAAKTWDEWFARGIKSCGYHRAGETVATGRPTRSTSGSSDRSRGYLGRLYFKVKGIYSFYDEHDFHDCKHGKGGGGKAGAGLEINIPLENFVKDAEIDFPAFDWIFSHTDLVLDGWWKTAVLLPDESEGYEIDADGEYWGGDVLLRVSAYPGEPINPYIGFGWSYRKIEETVRVSGFRRDYNWWYGWYQVPYDYTEDESESISTTTLSLGLELNLTSRLSLRGEWAYYGKGGWSESKEDYSKSRQIVSLDANLRLFSGFFLTLSGTYEDSKKEHEKTLGAGFGYLF